MSRIFTHMDIYLINIISVLFFYITSVECLKCLQCSSLFDRGCKTGEVNPLPCYNESYVYCLKYETKDKDVKFVTRDCSTVHVSGCNDMNFQGQVVTVCRSTCTFDGCNGADTLHCKQSLTDHIVTLVLVGLALVVANIHLP